MYVECVWFDSEKSKTIRFIIEFIRFNSTIDNDTNKLFQACTSIVYFYDWMYECYTIIYKNEMERNEMKYGSPSS